jgi:hypothetical protein
MNKRKPITNPEEKEEICFCYPPVELSSQTAAKTQLKRKKTPYGSVQFKAKRGGRDRRFHTVALRSRHGKANPFDPPTNQPTNQPTKQQGKKKPLTPRATKQRNPGKPKTSGARQRTKDTIRDRDGGRSRSRSRNRCRRGGRGRRDGGHGARSQRTNGEAAARSESPPTDRPTGPCPLFLSYG